MPDLFDVAKHFDDIAITDGYTAVSLFNGQFSTFLEASPDGSTSQRRTLSLAPGLSIPTRRVISALGELWIVGLGTLDGIFGAVIRQSFWIKRVTDSASLLTPGQAALNSAGTTVYIHREYLKDTVNGVSDAEYDPFWEIYTSPSEGVTKGHFLKVGTTYYRVRSSHLDASGLTNAPSDEIDAGARVAVTFSPSGAYNPVTDVYAAASVATNGILLDRYKSYEQLTEADLKSMPGDMTLYVATSAVTPGLGKLVSIAGRDWRILAATAESDAWALHIRRA